MSDNDLCELCGESADDEMGEFWDENNPQCSVYAHAQCGIDAGMSIA